MDRNNYEVRDDGVYCCFAFHEKSAPCNYEKLSNEAIEGLLQDYRKEVLGLQAELTKQSEPVAYRWQESKHGGDYRYDETPFIGRECEALCLCSKPSTQEATREPDSEVDAISFLNILQGCLFETHYSEWADLWIDWYKAEKWLSSERALAVFVSERFKEIQFKSQREAIPNKDAERLQFLIDNDLWFVPLEEQKRGYRSTMPNARKEMWFERVGWMVNNASKESETVREAIDAAMAKEKG